MMKMTVEQHDWIKTGEAAELAGVTLHTIRAWIARAPAIGKRVGGRWRVRRDAIEAISAGEVMLDDYVSGEQRTNDQP